MNNKIFIALIIGILFLSGCSQSQDRGQDKSCDRITRINSPAGFQYTSSSDTIPDSYLLADLPTINSPYEDDNVYKVEWELFCKSTGKKARKVEYYYDVKPCLPGAWMWRDAFVCQDQYYILDARDAGGIKLYGIFSAPVTDTSTITIHELKSSATPGQKYAVSGYISKVYRCPPCPKGMMCKVCMDDNIIISEENKTIGSYSLSANDLLVFTENDLELGRLYSLTVEVTDQKSTTEPINDVKLISYELLD